MTHVALNNIVDDIIVIYNNFRYIYYGINCRWLLLNDYQCIKMHLELMHLDFILVFTAYIQCGSCPVNSPSALQKMKVPPNASF